MVFNKKDKQTELVGASAKIAAAERMKAAGRMAANEKDAEGQAYSQTIPTIGVFVTAVVLVMLAPDITSNLNVTGINALDSLVAGKKDLSITGSRDLDTVLTMMVRGFVVFLMAGLVPLGGIFISKSAKKGTISPFVACWAAILGLPLLFVIISEMIAPLL